MDVTLGVSVTGTDARIALIDANPPHAVIDESPLDVSELVSTLVATDRGLADTGHRLVATRVCSSDAEQAAALQNALADADLMNVSVVPQTDAVSAVARSLTPGETVGSLAAEGDTAALSIVDADSDTTSLIAVEPIHGDDRLSAYRKLLERFSEEPGGATSVVVMGGPPAGGDWRALAETSPIPLRYPDAPEFALARGAAMAGFRQQDQAADVVDYPNPELDRAETVLSPQSEQQLAYSQVDEAEDSGSAAAVPMQTPMRPLSAVDPEEVETDEEASAARPKVLLVGSTVAAIVVVGFAALAVSVAIGIRPTVSEQAVRMQEETVAGKYFPVAPGQGVDPDGENWTLVEKLPPEGEKSDVRTFVTKPLSFSSETGGPSGSKVIELFSDGTVGVTEGVDALTPPPAVLNSGVAPGIPSFVPRLIPDLSRVNMCQVLSFVGNMEAITANAVNNSVIPLVDVVNPVDGLSIKDLGVVAAVPSNRGALFSTDKSESAALGPGTIPTEIFQTDKSALGASQVLPPDTALIEALPAAGDNGNPSGVPILGEPITDVGAVIAEPVVGVPEPGGVLPDIRGPRIGPALPQPAITAPKPDVALPLPQIPGPKVDLPQPNLPAPKVDMPAPKVDMPAPQVDIPAPKVDLPAPKVNVPAPKPPPISIPDPPVSVPDPPVSIPDPPVVDIPDPPVVEAPVSPPVIDIPLPKFDVPAPAAPAAPAAPTAPAVPQIPLLPKLPFGENLFGGEG
ncbi:hypothetical protein [Mycobacterium hubeiense]|uniref:hypothetical protein n=1 Tax=Mycobacterium hubeiense TaxID=1867256 RepID=UPI000C7EE008|nr:hypothetical protein [Mycobacterium sp. QGD 101]